MSTIKNNTFQWNRTGLRFHEFGGLVTKNRFHGNDTAIFVTDNPENVTIRDNSFSRNQEYNIKLGIHVTEDVEVQGGDFGIPTGRTVGDMVFDKEDDGDLGKIILIP